jgi:hypothetical protein
MPRPGSPGLQTAIAIMTAQLDDEKQDADLAAQTFADCVRDGDNAPMDLAVGFAGLARILLILLEARTGTPGLEILQGIGQKAAAL